MEPSIGTVSFIKTVSGFGAIQESPCVFYTLKCRLSNSFRGKGPSFAKNDGTAAESVEKNLPEPPGNGGTGKRFGVGGGRDQAFFAILAQESFSATVRLNTG